MVKQSLEQLDYQFTSVSWKKWQAETQEPNRLAFKQTQSQATYQGMDIRI